MFETQVYVRRRKALRDKMAGQSGIVVLLGNAEAPAQYKSCTYKWRQDSTWLYFFGIDSPMFAAVMDLDNGSETIFSDDYSLDDIIWTGPMPTVASLAEKAGVGSSAPYAKLDETVAAARAAGRTIHTIPPTRWYNTMKLQQLGINKPSTGLIKAIVSLRLVKEELEIAELDKAGTYGQRMHTIARKGIRLGRIEQEIVGEMEGFCLGYGWGTSFGTILTQHGEIFHCADHSASIEPDRLMVIDAGFESNTHYASDFTRTYPTGGKFTSRQRDIYQIVCDCNELAFSMTAPGVTYRSCHLAGARLMLERLSELGLVHGNVDDMMELGVAGLFMPHGLGHNMGIDVHDMEDLGETLVGYDEDQTRSTHLGHRSLRMARRLKPGNVITDEPGIYFIPALIDQWAAAGIAKDFINYDKVKTYYGFGGIRLEDDVLVTEDGARRLGAERLPIQPDDVEEAMYNDKNA